MRIVLACLFCAAAAGLVGCSTAGGPGSSGPAPVPAVTLSATSLTFSNVVLNTASAAQTITLTNSGKATLTLSSIALGGTNAAAFTTSNNCGTAVAAGAACMIAVSYTPPSTANSTAQITLTDNAATSPQTIALAGTTAPVAALAGTVEAGGVAVAGATVQLYAAGTAGNGSTPTALSAPVVTAASGAFVFTAAYACPQNTSLLYLVARGGQVASAGSANAGTVLATIIGPCNAVTPVASYTIDEATTVATAYAFAQFLSPGGNIGASSTNAQGLALAAATDANLVNETTGQAPGLSFPLTGAAPTATINTLANALNACIVSTGPASAACTQLYASTGAPPASLPTNTFDAAAALAQNTISNTSGVYAVAQMSTAYSPVLPGKPSDWTMFATFGGGGMSEPTAMGFDSTGKLWVADHNGVASFFSNTGTPVFASGITGDDLEESYGLAVDANDIAWITNQESGGGVNNAKGSITLLNAQGVAVAGSTGYTAGGVFFPAGIAMDRNGTAWVVDYGNSSVTLLSNSGAPLSGTSGYSDAQIQFPVAVAIDSKHFGYIGNQSANTVTKVAPDGSSFTSFVVGGGPSGIAVDGADNIWTANYYGSTVGLVSSQGVVLSSGGFTGGGISYPNGIAIDGGGTVWVANYRAPGISKLAGATTALPGAALSPAAGLGVDSQLLQAFALAIDASGNLWVTSFANNTVTEFIGLAVPVKTPLLGPVRVP